MSPRRQRELKKRPIISAPSRKQSPAPPPPLVTPACGWPGSGRFRFFVCRRYPHRHRKPPTVYIESHMRKKQWRRSQSRCKDTKLSGSQHPGAPPTQAPPTTRTQAHAQSSRKWTGKRTTISQMPERQKRSQKAGPRRHTTTWRPQCPSRRAATKAPRSTGWRPALRSAARTRGS